MGVQVELLAWEGPLADDATTTDSQIERIRRRASAEPKRSSNARSFRSLLIRVEVVGTLRVPFPAAIDGTRSVPTTTVAEVHRLALARRRLKSNQQSMHPPSSANGTPKLTPAKPTSHVDAESVISDVTLAEQNLRNQISCQGQIFNSPPLASLASRAHFEIMEGRQSTRCNSTERRPSNSFITGLQATSIGPAS